MELLTNAYGKQASPSDYLGVSLLLAKRYNQQPSGSGHICDAGVVGTNGHSASADGNIDALVGFSTGAPTRGESQQENIINLDESPREPATPAGLLGGQSMDGPVGTSRCKWIHRSFTTECTFYPATTCARTSAGTTIWCARTNCQLSYATTTDWVFRTCNDATPRT